MKNTIFAKYAFYFVALILAFGVVTAMPAKAHAFEIGQLIDPACLFACNNRSNSFPLPPLPPLPQLPSIQSNSYYNSNNYYNDYGYGDYGGYGCDYSCNTTYNYPPPTPPAQVNHEPLRVNCYALSVTAHVGDSVTWSASAYGGPSMSYNYTWTGDDGLSGYGSSVSKTYTSAGFKNASVRAISGNQSVSINCTGAVEVVANPVSYETPIYNYNRRPPTTYYPPPTYYPAPPVYTPPPVVYTPPPPIYVPPAPYPMINNNLDIGCYADPSVIRPNQPLTWVAEVTGGYAPYTYSWTGSDGLNGNQATVIKYYSTAGEKSAIVTVTSADGKTGTRACSTTAKVQSAAKPVVKAKPAPAPVVKEQTSMTAASLFSLQNVPWGWVAILIILVLFATVLYLLFNKQKI